MENSDTVVAIFSEHTAAEAAIKKLAADGIDVKHISLIGKGYSTDEKVVGFYNAGDRVKVWGSRGAFWGGLWGWLFGGVFLFVPVLGHVFVLGWLATSVISALEGAVVVGGISALSAALISSGIPKDSVLKYETEINADSFLVLVRGTGEELARARTIIDSFHPARIDRHEILETIR